jgi:plasmid stabilization system protein ParE
VTREVIFAPEALTDLYKLYEDIALDAGTGRAQSYTDRIIAHCLGLVTSRNAARAATIYVRACEPRLIAVASPLPFTSPTRP